MSSGSKHFYEFGPFRLDPAERLLLRHDQPVSLPPKAFVTLVSLVERGGHVFGKEELMRAVWPETFVEENNLTQCVSVLRKALGEDGNGRGFIETVPKLGYRFVADVREVGEERGDLLLAKHTKTHIVIREQEEHEISAPEDAIATRAIARTGSFLRTLRSKKWLAVLAGSAAVLVATSLFFYSHRPAKLTERDEILLADFQNSTGEPVFDATLKQALAIKLEESPFLNIVPEQRVRETLGLMGRPADERLTPPIAQEVCQRQVIKATVAGSIARIGSHYVIALQATNCLTGESLGREQVDVADREQVLPAVGKASSELRKKLGESMASIQKLDTPIQEAATSSLEALRAFTLGEAQRARGALPEAVPFYEHAIELDPDFTLPYDGLAAVYTSIGERDKAIQNKKKEFELRQHASQRQRFGITITYYYMVTGELDKADSEYEVYEQMYPREFAPHINRAALNIDFGRFDHALQEALEGLSLNPNNGPAYYNAGWAALRSGQTDQAKSLFEQAVSRKLAGAGIHRGLFAVAFLQTDTAAMQREAELSKGKEEYRILFLNAEVAASAGKLKEAREAFQQSAQRARENHLDEVGAAETAGRALIEAGLGNYAEAHQQALNALDLSHGRDTLGLSASALALSGNTKRAEACLQELAERYPLDTLVNAVAIPAARAAIEIHRGEPARAVEVLRAATPYEFGPFVFGQGYLPGYLRGQAYLREGDGTLALAEFQRILDHRNAAPFAPLYPLAHLGRARAYAAQGDWEKSRRAYQEFFLLWKDADPEIPVLKQAKTGYAKLQ